MSTTKNLFELATRTKMRFPSTKGDLTAEQLWDVPLRSGDGFNLDAVGKTTYKALKDVSEESFVETTKNPAKDALSTKLDVIKYVIDVKVDEEVERSRRAARKAEKEELLGVLAEKQKGELSELSVKELKRKIAALD